MPDNPLAVVTVAILAATVPAQRPDPAPIAFDALVAVLREDASPRQLEVMRSFGAQDDAPAALPDLLALLREQAPAMDNNLCLAIELILTQHPTATCDLEPLLEAVERKIWNSQQKAAQALWHALRPAATRGAEERIARALIPLTTSQRSRVFRAGTRCLQKLSGETHGPDPAAWTAWFEKRFDTTLDLSDAVYELVAVVRRGKAADGTAHYEVNGAVVGDAAALEQHLRALAARAGDRDLALAGVVQISDEAMAEIAKTMDLGAVEEPIGVFRALRIQGTVSPASDVFRPPWRPAETGGPGGRDRRS